MERIKIDHKQHFSSKLRNYEFLQKEKSLILFYLKLLKHKEEGSNAQASERSIDLL